MKLTRGLSKEREQQASYLGDELYRYESRYNVPWRPAGIASPQYRSNRTAAAAAGECVERTSHLENKRKLEYYFHSSRHNAPPAVGADR